MVSYKLGRVVLVGSLGWAIACGDRPDDAAASSTSEGTEGSGASTAVSGSDDTEGGNTETPGETSAGESGEDPDDEIEGLAISFEQATPEQLAIVAPVVGQVSPDATVAVRYRAADDGEWVAAHPLLRVHPEWTNGGAPVALVDAFAGTIFDLSPGTTYDVELTLVVPGVADRVAVVTANTRPLPAEAPLPTQTVGPTDDLQAALASLTPGDVLELAPGSYDVEDLYLDTPGTADAPIYIRGASRTDVVLSDPTGAVLQLQNASHVVLENLTIRGSGVDSGTDASSRGISFWDGVMQQNVTLRGLDIEGVDVGIVASGPVEGVLVYDCDLQGNNVWQADVLESNATWNDDGIRVPGEGNAVFGNTLDGFGDSFAVAGGIHSAAVYFYRNRVTMTGDDAFEGDYATRNIGFYDNYITNSATFVSLDPLYGGPLYAFRNVVANTFRGPFKLNNTNSGFMFYNNTIVRTDGTTSWGWVQFNNGELRNWSYRNNLLIYRGTTGNLLAIESGGCDPLDFTHNAYYPDGKVWWTNSGSSFATMGEAIAGVGQTATSPVFGSSERRHEHDVVTQADPFATPLPLGDDHLTEISTSSAPELAAGTSPKHAGVAIPNVTDGYTGPAPDIGAIIEGRPVPHWGAQR